jgi:hypothetical protein
VCDLGLVERHVDPDARATLIAEMIDAPGPLAAAEATER